MILGLEAWPYGISKELSTNLTNWVNKLRRTWMSNCLSPRMGRFWTLCWSLSLCASDFYERCCAPLHKCSAQCAAESLTRLVAASTISLHRWLLHLHQPCLMFSHALTAFSPGILALGVLWHSQVPALRLSSRPKRLMDWGQNSPCLTQFLFLISWIISSPFSPLCITSISTLELVLQQLKQLMQLGALYFVQGF